MVNTFLPFGSRRNPLKSIVKSVKCLDDRRLGRQRAEGKMILSALDSRRLGIEKKGWVNHPAVIMWEGYDNLLKIYINECINEFVRRGKNNNMPLYDVDHNTLSTPWWFGWKKFHMSHQAALVIKDAKYYGDMFDVPKKYLDNGYVWPSKLTETDKNKDISDIAAPLVRAEYCKTLVKSGPRQGQECHNKIHKKDAVACGVHSR